MLLKQTKIVATISDQRCDVDFIKQLFDAGLNVVRMNTAHAGREGFEKLIANVRTVSNRIAILMDTKGPEVRTTVLDEPIPFKAGDRVKVVGNPDRQTTRECISVSYPNFVHDLNVGGHILIDDGDAGLVVGGKDQVPLLVKQVIVPPVNLAVKKLVNVGHCLRFIGRLSLKAFHIQFSRHLLVPVHIAVNNTLKLPGKVFQHGAAFADDLLGSHCGKHQK